MMRDIDRIVAYGAASNLAAAKVAAEQQAAIAGRDEEFRRETDPEYRAFAERKDAEAAADQAEAQRKAVKAFKIWAAVIAGIFLLCVGGMLISASQPPQY